VRLKKAAHTVYKTQYHIVWVVWVTRYRRKILVKGVREYLKIKLEGIYKKMNSKKPHLIVIAGPNGAGKSTTS